MEKYFEFILKKPKTVITLILVITVFLGMGIPRLTFDNSIDIMMPQNDSEYIFYKKSQEIYGNVGKFILLDIFSDKNLWTAQNFREMDKLITDIEEYKDFNKNLEDARIKRYRNILKKDNIKYNDLLGIFSGDEVFKRTIARKIFKLFGNVETLSSGDLEKIEKEILLTYDIKKSERIDKIISPFTMEDIKGENDSLITFEIFEKDKDGNRIVPKTKKDFQRLRKILLKTPSYEKALFAKDAETGKITDFCAIVTLDTEKNHDNITRELWDIVKSNNYKNIEIICHGVPIINKELNDYMYKDMETFSGPIFLVIILIFFLNFKSFRGVMLPLVILTISVIWILGLMGWSDISITIMSVGLPTFMMAVGSSYAIHILNQYYIDFSIINDKGKFEGLKISMSHIAITVMLAGVTTFIGFLSLTTNHVTAISQWAFFSAIGVVFCVFLTITMIPAVFILLPHRMPRIMLKRDNTIRKSSVDRIIPVLLKVSVKHHKLCLVCVIFVLLVSAIGIFRINVNTDLLSYFEEDDYIRKSMITISEKFDGASGINILIDSGASDGIMDTDFLNKVEEFRNWMRNEENSKLGIGNSIAFTDFIKKMHMVMNNDKKSFYKIPDTREEVIDYLELYGGDDEDSDGRPDDFDSYIDPMYRTLHVFARIFSVDGKTLGTGELEFIVNKIQAHLNTVFPINSTRITGETSVFIRLAQYVVSGQIKTLLLCLVIVSIVIILLFKNVMAGIVALIPMTVAVVINFGIMGWFNINLDMSTAMIASITIGVGVDDTIHFLNTFRFFRDKGHDVDETIEKTLLISGKAIIYTSLALIFGFSVLVLSNYVPIRYVGILLAVSMVSTTIGALVVLPATIKATGISLHESESDSFIWRYLYIGKLFRIGSEN